MLKLDLVLTQSRNTLRDILLCLEPSVQWFAGKSPSKVCK